MKNILSIAFAVIFLFTACSKHNSGGGGGSTMDTTTTTTGSSGPAVYVVGAFSNVSTQMQAAYWRNDTVKSLSGGTVTEGYCMAFSGTDVYVGGMADGQAAYWKNGSMVALARSPSSGTGEEYAEGIGLMGQDVYVAGVGRTTNGSAAAAYWKNGTYVQLSPDSVEAAVFSMAISGSNVYIVGVQDSSLGNFKTTSFAKIWVNGVGTDLSDGTTLGTAAGVCVSGNDVYVAGEVEDSTGTRYTGVYWKNGAPVVFADSPGMSVTIRGITISGSDIYISGIKSYRSSGITIGGYWKNGSFVQTGSGGTNFLVENLAILGSDTYQAYFTAYINTTVGGVYKDTQPTTLVDGVNTFGITTAVYVH